MANRIVGNVAIIDSEGTVISFPGGKAAINSIYLFATNTSTGVVELRMDAAADVVIRVDALHPHATFGGINFNDLTVKTLTAGTAFLYLR